MPENTSLSEREIEILKLVATGASNKEIAKTLYISANTVKVHLRNIFSKIGVESRTEAAMYVVNAGLLKDNSKTQEAGENLNDKETEQTSSVANPAFQATQEEIKPDTTPARLNRLRWWLLGALLLLIGLFLGWLILVWLPANQQPVSLSTMEENRWIYSDEMAYARSGLAVVTFENHVFSIAGETAAGISGKVESFNPETNQWESLTDKRTPVADINAIVIGGKIYVPGGRLSDGTVTDVLEIYDPRQDRWEQGTRLPGGISAYALAAFEGKLYLFGGWDGKKFVDTVYRYDPALDEWREMTGLSTPRGYLGAAVVGGKIYLVGGEDATRVLNLVEAYAPDLDDGVSNPWERTRPMPEKRSKMGVVGLADNLYVLGGSSPENNSLLGLNYDPRFDRWSKFETPVDYAWSSLGATSLGNYVYSIGGLLDGKPTSQNLAYQAIFTILLPVVR